jgi:hypothetical protein
MLCHSLFLSLFPQVPLLHTCSTTEFVYHHASFCKYIYPWICRPRMRENMRLLCFWSWLTSLNMMSSSSSIYHQTPCHYSLWLSNSPLCIYTTISWSIHQL